MAHPTRGQAELTVKTGELYTSSPLRPDRKA